MARIHRKDMFVADTTALTALKNHVHGDRAVLNDNDIWRYDGASEAVHDGATIIKPTNVVVDDPGRWLKVVAGTGDFSIADASITAAKLHAGVLGGVTLKSGAADPTAGDGVAATAPALYVRSNGELYVKSDVADTAGTLLAEAA